MYGERSLELCALIFHLSPLALSRLVCACGRQRLVTVVKGGVWSPSRSPQPANMGPMVQTSISGPRRWLTTRELAHRRRQRLLELLQQPAKPPASS
jgi:hypothetical protein